MYVFLALISMFIGSAIGCSVPHGWKVKTIGERAKQAEIVIYGKIIKSPVKWTFSKSEIRPVLTKKRGLYQVKIEVYCIFKGGDFPRYMNISNFGHIPGHCVNNQAIEDEKAILFVTFGDSGKLIAQKVNLQKSTMTATETNLLKVMKATHKLRQEPRSPTQEANNCPVISLFSS